MCSLHEIRLGFELSQRFLHLKKCVKTKPIGFKNLKNHLQTCTQRMYQYFFLMSKPRQYVLFKKLIGNNGMNLEPLGRLVTQ